MDKCVYNIEQLNLSLPPGYERRADAIARGVAKQLARMPVAQSFELKALTIPKVNIFNGETDQVIARRIAHSIHAQLHVSGQLNPLNRNNRQNLQSKQRGQHRGID
ncbi:MAG: hypothetical protein H6940_12175 [Burkholderiales bacterium]|nr:hypothetical protein [Nitrosomonas sp.]MCP5244165.1 hypothetical protein [Burkholderiales bacterium]